MCAFAIVSGTAEYPRNMNPGEIQRLEGTSAWKVRIKDSGTSNTYHLTPGSEYVFLRESDNSMKLYKQMAPNVSTQQ